MLYLVSTVILLTFLTHDTKSLTGAGTHPWNLWLGGVTIICELYYYILPYFFIMVEPLVIETRPVVFQTTVQTIYTKVPLKVMVETKRIELSFKPYQGFVLPLNYVSIGATG